MVCAVCLAIVLRRPVLAANIFALSWLVVLVLNPTDPFTQGCQLSFLSVFVLVWFASKVLAPRPLTPVEQLIDETRGPTEKLLRGLLRLLGVAFAISGIIGAGTREADFVQHLFIASTHAYLLIFTDRGRCYWLKVYEIPEGSRTAKGKSIANLVNLAPGEKINTIVPVKEFDDEHFLILVTKKGTIKKTTLSSYGNPRKAGIIAINLRDEDTLIDAALTDGKREILIAKRQGNVIRFNESTVRPMGRTAGGVRGVTLEEDDDVIGMVALEGGEQSTVLAVTQNGFGKRSPVEDYRVTGRGGKGVITIKNTPRNGPLVAIKEVTLEDQLMIITRNGVVIRLRIKEVSELGRNTQGVRMVNVDEGDAVMDVARLMDDDEA